MWTIIFGAAGTFVVYVLIFYPLLLGFIAKQKGRPVRKEWRPWRVSVLIAVRNGAVWIGGKLRSVFQADYPPELLEVIVVSDGSTDATDEIVREFARVQLIRITWSGKAVALNAAMGAATGEVFVFTDARQPLDRSALRNLVAPFADPTVGAVSAEPSILQGESQEEADIALYYTYETRLRTWLSQIDSVPSATGPLYAMRRELTAPLPPDTLGDDLQLPTRAFLRGYRCILEPAAKVFEYPTALHSEFRRKVRTLAGLYQLIWRYPCLLTPANRMWLHLLSYKVGRLLLPFALLLMALATACEIHTWGRWMLWPEVLCCGLGLADLAIPQTWGAKRVSSPVRTFAVLMIAALCAASIAFLPARRFWTTPTTVRPARGTQPFTDGEDIASRP